MNFSRFIFCSFFAVILCLFFYSFTQIDLGLSFGQASIWQSLQKSFQQVGYFNRPLSTLLFVLIISGMFAYYIYFLVQAHRKRIKIKDIWVLIGFTSGILAFSYNAFSYDLFNYIFDAKIITFYHQNPYLHKALDYPMDPMLSFMHWTHRLYPYGPFWLALTAPLSFSGLNIFLLTFFLFKFFIAGCFLGSVYLIYKINQKINPDNAIFNTVLFGLNPLVIIESLISSHNDIVMVFFALFGLYVYLVKNKLIGIVLVFLSSMIKIPTAALILPLIINIFPLGRYKLSNDRFILWVAMLSIGGIIYSMTKLEIQPWYFLWVIPFVSLLKFNKYVSVLVFGISLGLLLRYVPYLYYGNWEGIGVSLRNGLTVVSALIPSIFIFIYGKLRKSTS